MKINTLSYGERMVRSLGNQGYITKQVVVMKNGVRSLDRSKLPGWMPGEKLPSCYRLAGPVGFLP